MWLDIESNDHWKRGVCSGREGGRAWMIVKEREGEREERREEGRE